MQFCLEWESTLPLLRAPGVYESCLKRSDEAVRRLLCVEVHQLVAGQPPAHIVYLAAAIMLHSSAALLLEVARPTHAPEPLDVSA